MIGGIALGGKILGALLGGLGWLRDGLVAAARWVLSDLRHAVIVILALSLVLTHFDREEWRESSAEWQDNATRWKSLAQDWSSLFRRFRAKVDRQRLAAERDDRRNAARVERRFAQIRERTAHDYQDRLADTRATLERLRSELDRARERDGNGTLSDVPQALSARCRALGAADCDALLASLPGQLAAAETNTAKLIELQNYVRSSLQIDFGNPPRPREP